MLVLKYHLDGDDVVLEECIQMLRLTPDEIPADHQYRPVMLITLEYRLKDWHALKEACACFQAALGHPRAAPIIQIRAGTALVRSCPDKQQAYEAAQLITELLPESSCGPTKTPINSMPPVSGLGWRAMQLR